MKRNDNKRPIHERSIFGGYKSIENQATAALLHILDMGGPHMVEYAFEDALSSGNIKGYLISAQANHGTSRPDGEILADYNLIIESKICSWNINEKHNESQLKNHLDNAKKPGAILVYIINQTDIPQSIAQSNCWVTTWTDVIARLRDFNRQRTYFNKELMNYLIDQLELLINSKSSKTGTWESIPQKQRVVIVGGNKGEDVALYYGFYACQYNRNFKDPSYIAFYHKKRIKYVFKIINHARLDSLEKARKKFKFDFKDYFQNKDPEYLSKSKEEKKIHFFVLGEKYECEHEIIHEDTYAYVQRQRYTSIELLKSAKTTKDL